MITWSVLKLPPKLRDLALLSHETRNEVDDSFWKSGMSTRSDIVKALRWNLQGSRN